MPQLGQRIVRIKVPNTVWYDKQTHQLIMVCIFQGGGQLSEGESGNASVVARTYLLRLKNEEETAKLAAAIKDNAPSD